MSGDSSVADHIIDWKLRGHPATNVEATAQLKVLPLPTTAAIPKKK